MRYFAVLAFLGVLTVSCTETTAVPSDPHLDRAEALLERYVAIDTTGGAAGYRAAAELIAAELRAAGIEPRTLTPAGPDYPLVYARLEAVNGERGALILMHHTDVVPVEPASWTVPAFSGRRVNGYLWGRGAIDDKSLGIAHLESFLDLHRTGARLARDVVFLAVPDEEKGGRNGIGALLEQNPELFGPDDVVLTEGGATDTTVNTVSIWSIDVAQKVPLWIRITVRGSGGHGASSSESSSETLIDILSDVRRSFEPETALDAETERMIASRSRAFGGDKRRFMSKPRRSFDEGTLIDALGGGERAAISDSMIVTTLHAGSAVNVVPSNAYAELDFRLLRTTDPADTIARVRDIVGERATVEVLLEGVAAPASPVDHVFFRLLEQRLPAVERNSIVVPMVSPATTDARYFRARGIAAYGFSPFKINFYDAGGIHGSDERIRISFFREGVRVMREIVRAYCVAA